MATRLTRELMRGLGALRYEPTQKWVRAYAGGELLVDSRQAVLVWEPKRIVPSYAVPEADLRAIVTAAPQAEAEQRPERLSADGPPVLSPTTPFAAHTADGEPVTLQVAGVTLPGAGFRLADPDLAGHVVLDFDAFDEWREEDEPIVAHPRDPFSRIDIRQSSRRVRIELDGVVLADSGAPRLLFETRLPPRFYLPREDVRMELLSSSDKRTACAYKGHASYWSAQVGDTLHRDLAWTYLDPLYDARAIAGRIAFFNERVDLIVDGELLQRPVTPWSPPRG